MWKKQEKMVSQMAFLGRNFGDEWSLLGAIGIHLTLTLNPNPNPTPNPDPTPNPKPYW